MENQNYCINITSSVISKRDNIDIKDRTALLERQLTEKAMRPEVEVLIPKQRYFSDIDDKPVQTRFGRQVRKPERYGT